MNVGIKRELKFACLMKKADIKFVHHPSYIPINGQRYHADFYLPTTDEYIEIIGSRQAFHSRKEKIQKAMEFLKIKVLNPDGSPYNHHNNLIVPKHLKSMDQNEHGLKTCICGIKWLPNNKSDSNLCGQCKRKQLLKKLTAQNKISMPNSTIIEKTRLILKYLRAKYQISYSQWEKDLSDLKYKVSESTIRRFVESGISISPQKILGLIELVKKMKQQIPNQSLSLIKF